MPSALKRATQMGDFEVAKGGGIWVANRDINKATREALRITQALPNENLELGLCGQTLHSII